MKHLTQDLRHAGRRLGKAPLFSLVAIATLALGVGATTAVYSIVEALLLRPLPYREPGTLRRIEAVQGSRSSRFLTPAIVAEWRSRPELFPAVEPYRTRSVAVLGEGEPQFAVAAEVGGGLMEMLGIRPRLGRMILPQDAASGSDGVVVLSDALWRTRFGADPGIIGRTVRIDDRTREIVGVMPRSFLFPVDSTRLWIPLPFSPSSTQSASALARLAPGQSAERVQQRADTIAAALQTDRPARFGWNISLQALDSHRMNASERYALYVLAAAVALVLLIACANLASLLLVQGAGREREIAVRAAIGATRSRLVRQLVTESLVLASLGGLVGIVLALWAIDLLAAHTPRDFTFLAAGQISVNTGVLAFALGLTLAAGFGSGLVPALRISRTSLQDALRSGARQATAPARQERLRRAFVVAQLALSIVLLVGAGLLTRSFTALTRIDPGFEAQNLVAVDLSLPRWKYGTRAAQRAFFEQAAERLRGLPGVQAVTVAGGKPPVGGGISFGLRFEIEGVGVVLDDPDVLLPNAEVNPEYFSVLGVPIVAGRTFAPGDDSPIIINREMANRLWKGASPLGQRLRLAPDGPWHTVVGVAGDVYEFDYEKPRGMFGAYFPMAASDRLTAQETLIVRTATEPEGMLAPIRERIWSVDPDLPILKAGTISSMYGSFFSVPRFQAVLMGTFALMGLGIAAVGLYGVLSYSIAQRTREFGIRVALGAGRGDVLRIVFRQVAGMLAAGLVLGAGGALALGTAMRSLVIGVPPSDPLTYAVVLAVLALTAIVATWLPARRATRVDPATALLSD